MSTGEGIGRASAGPLPGGPDAGPMGPVTIEPSQRTAARIVGLAYLLALPPGVFAELFVLGRLIVHDDAAQTARNILAHERLFRLGIASNLGVFALDVVLITALYVTLRPVHRGLALLALLWRLIETMTLVSTTFNDFTVLRVLGGAAYLRAFGTEPLQALARLAISAHGATYNVGLFFAGLGSSVFCWLWFKSAYMPRLLAAWGVFASALMGACALTFIVFPEVANVVTIGYFGGPIFAFELTAGAWLLFRGIRPPAAAAA